MEYDLAPWLQAFVPQHALSAFAGLLANARLPWLKNCLIDYFIKRYPVNLTEAVESNPFAYPSYNDFFTRALKPEVRPVSPNSHELVSPADGCISQLGNIEDDKLLQAKEHFFTAAALLGDTEKANTFKDGSFLTVYLAPHDYHRVHMPIDGTLTHMIYVPGSLFSVNEKTTDSTKNLFARNERVISLFDTPVGKVAVVLVGAMLVGSIETIWAGTLTPPHRKSIATWEYKRSIFLKKGEEMGRFKLGSTVIVLFEKEAITLNPEMKAGGVVRMGQCIGQLRSL